MTITTDTKIIIATGDPAGIGIEIILKALYSEKEEKRSKSLIIGCKKSIEKTYFQLHSKGISNIINPINLNIEDIPFTGKLTIGKPSSKTGESGFKCLGEAVNIAIKNKITALVTAPISKYYWHKAGYNYPGQTERLAELTNTNHPSMLFTAVSPINGWRLNTLLTTTHIPIRSITETLNPDLIHFKLDTLLNFCKRFKRSPNLAIAGLNPHSGEKGQIGHEEEELIIPIINKWKKLNPGINLQGPIPPDTCWLSAKKAWTSQKISSSTDGYLALYHDQGLIPMKLIAFDEAVNTTIGLPFIRTSPDHGTAFDIAGKGIANPESMLAAIKTAWELSRNF